MTHDFEISLLFGKFLWIADFKGKKKTFKDRWANHISVY